MSSPTARSTARIVLVAVILGLWAAVTLPLALGQTTLYYRDVFTNHLPLKAFGAEELRQGRIPTFNPRWGLGQPFRGNPSALAFYPGNVLYLALPFWNAFNLHFALHWLLAGLGMALLARQLGLGPWSRMMAGVTYGGSGWMLSNLSFYNLIAVAAWWPLVLAGAARGGRRGLALSGLACGMALLGGEPVTAALGLVPLVVVAARRQGSWLGGFVRTFAIGLCGLALALPQVVSTLRVIGFSLRGAQGSGAPIAAAYGLHPQRLVELLVPLPFGWPGYLGKYGFWARGLAEQTPFFLTLYAGVVALVLALVAARRERGARDWALLAAAGLGLAIAGRYAGGALDWISGGLFRYPEKFLFWTALALPLLAGFGLGRLVGEGRGPGLEAPAAPVRSLRWTGIVLVAAAIGVLALRQLLAALFAEGSETFHAYLRTQGFLLALGFAIAAGLVLALGKELSGRRRATVVVGLQLVALVQLWPLVMVDRAAPYRASGAWEEGLEPGDQVLNAEFTLPEWEQLPAPVGVHGPVAIALRDQARDLAMTPGVMHGLGYPFAPNMEGLGTLLQTLTVVELERSDWPARVNWLRVTGVERVVSYRLAEPVPGLVPLARSTRYGNPRYLYAVEEPAPEVWWPRRIAYAATSIDAFRLVSAADDPLAVVASPVAVEHDPRGRVRALESSPDRLIFEVESGGGVVAVRRSYHPLWRASLGGRRLQGFAIDVFLTGVRVPPGHHRVVLEAASSRPEVLAGGVSLVASLGLAVLTLSARRRGRGSDGPRIDRTAGGPKAEPV